MTREDRLEYKLQSRGKKMLELDQIENFNSDMKKHLMELVVQLRETEGADLEEGVILKIEYHISVGFHLNMLMLNLCILY